MKFGYARISTADQKLDMQIDALLRAGCEMDNIYTDVSSGARTKRKGMDLMLTKLRKGDEVIVWRLDRMARSVSHMNKLVESWEEEGISFRSIQEPQIDTSSSFGKFIFVMCSAFAQLERDILVERTKAGLAAARKKGRKGGRKPGLSKESKKKARIAASLYREGNMTVTEMLDVTGIKSKATLYKYLRIQGVEIDGFETLKK